MHVHIYIYTHTHIYIYIYRERERENKRIGIGYIYIDRLNALEMGSGASGWIIYLLILQMEQQTPKKNFYNKERHEKNKEEILINRREKYRTQHNKDLVNIKVCKSLFTLYLD